MQSLGKFEAFFIRVRNVQRIGRNNRLDRLALAIKEILKYRRRIKSRMAPNHDISIRNAIIITILLCMLLLIICFSILLLFMFIAGKRLKLI